jgi:F-type H+-transporting ATPase subunit epsilon
MASYSPFTLTITNVAGSLFEGMATLVTVPSVDGTTTVLAHHEPIITLLKKGVIRLVDEMGKEREFSIEGGVLEVSNNKTIILV